MKVTTIAGEFDEQRYRKLKAAYYHAMKSGQEEFDFEDHLFLTKFVKYLLEVLSAKFKE